MYSREEVKAIADKIMNMAKADAVEVEFNGGERSATRFANSTITANMVQFDRLVGCDSRQLLRVDHGGILDAGDPGPARTGAICRAAREDKTGLRVLVVRKEPL